MSSAYIVVVQADCFVLKTQLLLPQEALHYAFLACQVKSVAAEIGAGFLSVGFDPTWKFEEVPRMPKERYRYGFGFGQSSGLLKSSRC